MPAEEMHSNEEGSSVEPNLTEIVEDLTGFEECKESDLQDWINICKDDIGFQILNDEVIVASVKNGSDE